MPIPQRWGWRNKRWSVRSRRTADLPESRSATAPSWLVLGIGLFHGIAFAYPDVAFDRLSVEHGLAQSAVQDMVQDDAGFLWVGTQYGLSRFDGYRFRNFRHESDNPDTLSHSRIMSLHLGGDGKLWVGSVAGINRLDPQTLEIERVVPLAAPGEFRLPFRPYVQSILEDHQGNVVIQSTAGILVHHRLFGWFSLAEFSGSTDEFRNGEMVVGPAGRVWFLSPDGLWKLDRSLRRFQRILGPNGFEAVRGSQALAVLPTGLLALVSSEGLLRFDPEQEQVVEHLRPREHGHAGNHVRSVAADSRGHLWAVVQDALVEIDAEGRWKVRHRVPVGESEFSGRGISLAEDQRGHIWLGTNLGVGLAAPGEEDFRFFRHDPSDRHSLGASPLTACYKVLVDDFGAVWVGGGLGGLSRFAPQSVRFETIREHRITGQPGAANIVRSLLETRSQGESLLWVGLESGGIRVWRRNGGRYSKILHRLHDRADPLFRLPHNSVWRLRQDPEGSAIWAGTGRGLAVIDSDSAKVIATHEVMRGGRNSAVNTLAFTRKGRLVLAMGHELRLFELDDRRTGIHELRRFSILPEGGEDGNHRIMNLHPLDDGRIAVATRRGLVLFDPESGSMEWFHPAGRPGELARNYLFGLAEQPSGTLWIGTSQGGAARMSLDSAAPGAAEFEWFDTGTGLVDDTVYAIVADAHGDLWLSSNRGLTRFDPERGRFHHFTPRDGLQDFEFNNSVAHAGDSGRLYFGGIRGANAFRPEKIAAHPEPPLVLLETVEVKGRIVSPNDGRLELEHDENALSLSFVGLHFVDPGRNRYAYRLEGVDDDWVDAGHVRQARYPDLAPGRYRFHVRAANSDGIWSDDHKLLELSIAAPPWMTPWAYWAYVLSGLLLLGMVFALQVRRRHELEATVSRRTRELVEQKQLVDRQAGELEEALNARTALFANISHEFRTPLTLIQASLDSLERKGGDSDTAALGRRYVRRLLRLVDQLLELSRLRSEPKRPQSEPWPVSPLVDMTVEAFRSLAEQKGIELVSDIEPGWLTRSRKGDVERILLNLVGNGLKYCRSGDRVEVALKGNRQILTLTIADNGPGMSESQQLLIFERFHRLPAHEAERIQGTGIGLTLVREAAKVNGGEVEIDSRPGEGTVFRVTLPAWHDGHSADAAGEISTERLALELESLGDTSEKTAVSSCGQKPESGETVLIVEDHPDLRAYLRRLLAQHWRILQAADGREALQLARERMPDAVVSDIMMPEMDGLELLRKLRGDLRTSHLPVLLLTARRDDRTRLEGYSLSADDFLAKPFEPQELRLRVARMIDNRRRMQKRLAVAFNGNGGATESQKGAGLPDLSERDQRLLERVREWLQAHYGDPKATTTDMAAHAAVEPRTLQRKLKALTGQTPAAYLQAYRLKCARELLRTTRRPVQDIAASCGFSSPQYFSRIFHRANGKSPNAWRECEC